MKNFIFNKVSIFRKSLLLTFILLFAFSCEQQDESADVNAEQANTEVRARQMQVKAREIVNSEEFNNAINQSELFAKKIYDEHFFTEDLFDAENNTYNYDLIKERLSMTSFKSAEEFVREYEDMFYSVQKLVKKNPELADLSIQTMIEEEYLKRTISSKSWEDPCAKQKKSCRKKVSVAFFKAEARCVAIAIRNAGAGAACMAVAFAKQLKGYYRCKVQYKHCWSGPKI